MKDKIKRVVKTKTESLCYDIEVEGNNNFFANGVLVHNCQNLASYWNTKKELYFEVTEKRDGQSITCAYSPTIDTDEPFMVCSRNIRLKREDRAGNINLAWRMAEKYNLEEKLKAIYESDGIELAIQSEQQGAGIQSNRDRLEDYTWDCFKIWDITNQQYLTTEECVSMCERLAIPHVPVINPCCQVFQMYPTMDAMLEAADGMTARGNRREGLVFKQVGSHHPVSFKAVSNKYLMKCE